MLAAAQSAANALAPAAGSAPRSALAAAPSGAAAAASAAGPALAAPVSAAAVPAPAAVPALGSALGGVPVSGAASPASADVSAVEGEVLLSQGKVASASSAEGGDTAAAMAVDGNAGTRWSSAFSDAQWLQVDLGAPAVLSRIVLTWEAAYGRGYKLQGSADGSSWADLKTITDGDGGTDTHAVTGTARYVRMLGTQRG
ncbi:MAG: discoidin domain-containing protein, partial [Nonomuraea sp.]|nr:discoidin domain-containing protein [Nonomuraea sp.]